jgi:hypothetical protein
MLTSSDGITWTQVIIPGVTGHLYSDTYNYNLFVAVGVNGKVVTSTDAVNWSVYTVGNSNNQGATDHFYSVTSTNYDNGTSPRFVAVGHMNNSAYSMDGINWSSSYTPNYNNYWGVAFDGTGRFFRVGYNLMEYTNCY